MALVLPAVKRRIKLPFAPKKTFRPPPPAGFQYDVAFQEKILRVLYQDPVYTCTIGTNLSPAHFEKRTHKWTARTILDYAEKHGHGISEDALLIAAERDIKLGKIQKKDIPVLAAVIDKLSELVVDRSFVREELFRFIKNQVTRDAILNSLDHLDVFDYDAVDREFNRVLEVREALTGGMGHRVLSGLAERTKRRKSYVKNGVPCGLRLDDHMKPGGLPPKAIGCFIAPTGGGKSHALVHIGKSAIVEGNAKVLHITLELSEESIEDRYDASFSGITLNALDKEHKRVAAAVEDLGRRHGECLVIKEFPPVTLTVPALRNYMRQLERTAFYPTLLIVDYADLMLPSRVYDQEHEGQGNVYTELRKLAVELGIPVWTAAQTGRSGFDKESYTLSSIEGAIRKPMICDVVMAQFQTEAEKKLMLARIGVLKNRLGGQDFEFKVRLDHARSTIKNL